MIRNSWWLNSAGLSVFLALVLLSYFANNRGPRMSKAVIPPITKLSEGVIRILGMNPGHMTLQGTNTYLLGRGKRRILIDAGEPGKPEYITNLKNVLKDEGTSLQHIIVSHWHNDHIGGVKDILENVIQTESVSIWKFPRSDGEEEEGIPLKFLKDGDVIETEDCSLRVYHTPGHTTDHIVLMDDSSGHMFSGDNVLGEGTTVFEDLYSYMHSLARMLKLNPSMIYPGHGPVVDDPVQKMQYYINHRNEREAQILQVLQDRPQEKLSCMDIVKIVYAGYDPQLFGAASFNVMHHLEKLLKEKKVLRFDDDLWQFHKQESSL